MIDEKRVLEEIANFKKCQKSENCDYLTGYISALSAVEEMIANQPKVGEWIPHNERLTKRINLGNGKSTVDFSDKRVGEFPDHQSGVRALFERLAYYEDLEEKGTLVLFPRYAYFIKDNKYYKGWVQEVVHCVCRKPLYDIRYDDYSLANYRGYLGNTVFLTKEEAKAALKKRRKDGN